MRTATELPVYKRLDLSIVAGDGVHVVDDSGRRYLDLYGGHATALLGYGHPAVLGALETQARTLFFQTNLVDVPVRRRAAEALGRLLPDPLARVFFVNSGAEANENALRLACRLTGRNHVVALEHGFHGRTAAAGAVSWGADRWYGFPRKPFDVTFIDRDDSSAIAGARTCVVKSRPASIGRSGSVSLRSWRQRGPSEASGLPLVASTVMPLRVPRCAETVAVRPSA